MSLIGGFANQTATIERYTGTDGFNKPTYAPPETIRVRRDGARGVKRSDTGTDVAVESEYLTEAEVSVQDRVDGTPVRRVEEIVGKNGVLLGYEFAT